jgi:hypothetical protein
MDYLDPHPYQLARAHDHLGDVKCIQDPSDRLHHVL